MKQAFLLLSIFWICGVYGQTNLIERALNTAREKKYDEAIILIDSAIAADSNTFELYSIKAEFLWMSKNYYQAALIYQKTLLLDNDHRFLNGAYLML